MKQTNDTKSNGSKVFIVFYIISALIPVTKILLQGANTYRTLLAITLVFFIIGFFIFFTPAESLLRIDRGTGSRLSKLGPFPNSGSENVSTFYQLFGFFFMFFAIVINIISLFM